MPAPRRTYSRRAPSVTRPDTRQVLDRGHMLPEMLGEHPSGEAAQEAYDRFAPVYDEFNAQNDYEHWLGEVLLPELERHGLRRHRTLSSPRRVLDVGCGTGRAFTPLLSRGWRIHGCDASGEMLARAREKFGSSTVALVQADARSLGDLSEFRYDLILALNDVVNYLTEDGDLERAFEGMKRNLAPEGLVCFDANSLGLFEGSWVANGSHAAAQSDAPLEERGWDWKALTEEARPGGIFEAEVAGEGIDGPSVHRERHWAPGQIEEAMRAAGLRPLAVLGQREDPEARRIVLDPEPDESCHHKLIYIGRHQ